MAPQHIDPRPPPAPPGTQPSPRGRRPSGVEIKTHEPIVVVATQNLPRMSAAIAALINAGFIVTAYASPTRLLPRLSRVSDKPVALLVIDGGLTPAFGRAAAIAARSAYVDLPVILLAPEEAARRTDLLPAGVTLLELPLSEGSLVAAAAELTKFRSRESGWLCEPPDAA
jgi:hypothetical protein